MSYPSSKAQIDTEKDVLKKKKKAFPVAGKKLKE